MAKNRGSVTIWEAGELLERDGYYTDVGLLEEIRKRGKKVEDRFLAWIENSHHVAKWYDWQESQEADAAGLKVSDELDTGHKLIREYADEYYAISYPPEPPSSAVYVRIYPNAVLHLGKGVRTAVLEALELLLAYMGAPALPHLFFMWFSFRLYELGKKLVACYERLEDEDEKAVFETIYRLQNQQCVADYDALRSRKFDDAYASMSPRIEDIVSEVAPKRSKKHIADVLTRLAKRGILEVRDGRWSVKFW